MKVIQGTDYKAAFSAKDPETSVPLDLRSGFSFTGYVCKTTNNGETPLYVFPIGATGLLPLNGSLEIHIPAFISEDWEFERVVYGIHVRNTDTDEEIMGIRGPLWVTPTVA
jgi:hypothetical protein